jgi:hypothetical protein
MSGEIHVPGALYPENCSWHPLNKMTGGPHCRSGWCGEDKRRNLEWNPGLPSSTEMVKIRAYIVFSIFDSTLSTYRYIIIRKLLYYIVTYIPIARQRLDKHIPAETYAQNNRTSIARQRNNKEAFSTIRRLCFRRDPCRAVIKGQRRSFELVVENWVEFWRWQLKVIEKKLQETNYAVKRSLHVWF